MKLVILTRNPANTTAIKFIKQILHNDLQISAVILETPKKKKKKKRRTYWYRPVLRYFNFFKIFYRLYSLTCKSEKVDILKQYPTIHSFKALEGKIIEVKNHNSNDVAEKLQEIDADIILVLGTRILKEKIFNKAKVAINFHSGLVPQYRGAYTVFWAMRNGDFNNVGYTFHVVRKKVDEGEIIYQERVAVDSRDNERSAFLKIENIASKKIIHILKDLEKNDFQATCYSQHGEGHTYKGYPPSVEWFTLAMVLLKRRIVNLVKQRFFRKTLRSLYNSLRKVAVVFPQQLILEDQRCLVLAPHADDEAIGCGGILLAYPDLCDVICLTDGRYGGTGDPDILIKTREAEFISVMNQVGIRNFSMLGIEDNGLVDGYEPFSKIDLHPYDLIFIPNFLDEHPDHKALAKLLKKSLTCKRHAPDVRIAMYEVWAALPIPNYYIDLSDIVEKKKSLIRMYDSQTILFDFAARITALNIFRGMLVKRECAEMYTIVDKETFCSLVK